MQFRHRFATAVAGRLAGPFAGPLVAVLSVALALALIVGLPSGPALGQDTPTPPEGWELSGDPGRAQETYDQFCTNCHGPEGKGDGQMAKFLDAQPKDLTDTEYMETRSDYQLYLAIKKGGAAVGLSDKMAPWGPLLSEQDIQDLTLLVRRISRGEASGK